jgi:hypothetical protein
VEKKLISLQTQGHPIVGYPLRDLMGKAVPDML